MILPLLIAAILIRVLVRMTFDLLFYHYRINHINLPREGWRREVLEVLMSIIILGPIARVGG